MDLDDVEGIVIGLYERHGLDPREPVSPWELARRELGHDCFVHMKRLVGGTHAYRHGERWKIALSRALTTEYAAHGVGHELGHAVFHEAGVRLPRAELEALCDRFGAAVLAPAPRTEELFNDHRFDVHTIAKRSASTPTWAALRIGEVLGIPCAVVSPKGVRLRGLANLPIGGLRKAIGGGRTAIFHVAA